MYHLESPSPLHPPYVYRRQYLLISFTSLSCWCVGTHTFILIHMKNVAWRPLMSYTCLEGCRWVSTLR